MIWYVAVAVVSAVLIGWGLGVWYGSSKGYEAAGEEYQQIRSQQMWDSYMASFREDKHGQE